MKTGIKWLVGVWVVVMLMGVRQAEAISVTLSDNTAYPSEYFASTATISGASYKFDFSYWVDTAFVESQNVSASHDTFYYALVSSSSDLASGAVLFDNTGLVDIFGAIPQTNPTTMSWTGTAENFLIPYFLVGDGNSDYLATVYVDYTITQLQTTPVPEPSTMLLLGAGLLGLAGFARKRT